MLKHSIFLLLFVLSKDGLYAQKQFSFRSIQQGAFIAGKKTSAAWQTINGVHHSNWFAGIGAGIDYYHTRSIPLFLDIRKEFSLKPRQKIFVYGDIGYHLPWVNDKDDVLNFDDRNSSSWWPLPPHTRTQRYKGGLYSDVGIGYAFYGKNDQALLLSAGYSSKKLSQRVRTVSHENPPQEWENVLYQVNNQRIMIKVGWQF